MPAEGSRRREGKFVNPWPGAQPHGLSGVVKWMLERRGRDTDDVPRAPDSIRRITAHATPVTERTQRLTITWVGHSTFLVQCEGINVLTDPIWSERASPLAFAGPRRLVPPGVGFDQLPPIDIVLVSHDHYDHLDDATVRSLVIRYPGAKWLAPLGVGAFLTTRGASSVTELDWWQQYETLGLSIGCTPAQHFSGRYPWNRDSTLWCGWTVSFASSRFFFAGDTGLHPEFATIAERFGPFDMAVLPIGAYDPRWFMQPVHMSPEDSVAAFQQLTARDSRGSCVMVGGHWGTFKLTDEPVMEPPILTRECWISAGLPDERLWTLAHGERREITT